MINVGAVCRCQRGQLGVITSVEEDKFELPLYRGIKLDGSAWESKNPKLVAGTVRDFILLCAMDLDLFTEARA